MRAATKCRTSVTELSPSLFKQFSAIVYDRSGILLRPGKEALVNARIGKRLRALGLDDQDEYLAYLTQIGNEEELVQFIDAITTNVTSFFREADHFDFLEEIIFEWAQKGQRRFRLWCAAASTGEEPYTIAITLNQALENYPADIRILATDISTDVLAKGRNAIYPKDKLETVPKLLFHKYFDRINGGLGDRQEQYKVNAKLQRMLVFQRLNLAAPPFPMKGPFDVIFIRNVMIYFDSTVRKGLLKEAYRLLKPGGYLMVGHAESLTGMLSNFETVRPAIYIKPA